MGVNKKNYFVIVFFSLALFLGCNNSQKKIVDLPKYNRSYSLHHRSNFFCNNIQFEQKGAIFDTIDSYLLLNNFKVKKNKDFNISFWFRTIGESNKSQMLFSLRDTIENKNRFNLWIAGNRLTGKINSEHLWAENYNYLNPKSKAYYDSPKLENGKYYFLSLNVHNEGVEIYINSEIYQFFLISYDNINFHNLYLGIEKNQEEFDYQFKGAISKFKFYLRKLSNDEIFSVYNKEKGFFKSINDEFELKKFNL